MVDKAKISGILCEGIFDKGKMTALIVGVGININMTKEDFAGLDRAATSILIESQWQYKTDEVLQVFCDHFENLYQEFLRSPQNIAEKWLVGARLKNAKVHFKPDYQDELTGIVVGLEDDGAIMIHSNGKTQSFRTGELSFI